MNGEIALLSLLLTSKDKERVWIEINEVSGYKNLFLTYKEEFEFVKKFREKYDKFPTEEAFEKKFPAVVLGKPSEPIRYYLEDMENKFIYEGLAKINDSLVNGLSNEDPSDVLSKLNADLNKFQNVRKAKSDKNFSDKNYIDIRVKNYELRGKQNPINGIPTGWSPMDLETFGWQKSELIYILARPHNYKTWSLMSWLVHACRNNFSSLIFSKEMAISAIARRADALITKTSFKDLRRGLVGKDLDKFTKTLTKESKNMAPMFMVDSSGIKGDVLDFIWEKIRQCKPDVAFIDGVYLLGGKGTSDWEKQTYISRTLKDIAMAENIPIIGTLQGNRVSAGKKKKLALENPAYSDAYGQDADAMIGLNRIWDKENNRWENKVMAELIKHREGESTSFLVAYDLRKMDIMIEDVDVYDDGGSLNVSISEEDDVGEELLI